MSNTTVYLAPKNFGSSINAFKERKIAHLAPGRVSDAPIRVLAPFFHYPTSWFKFVLHTILTNTVTTFSTGFTFNLFKNAPHGIPFEVPVSTIRFNRLSDDQRGQLKALGMQQDVSNSNIFVGSLSPSDLKAVYDLGPVPDRMRPGLIDFDGFFAWSYLVKGVQAFCCLRNTFKGEVNMAYELKKSVKFDKDGDLLTVSGSSYTGKAPDGKRAIGTTSELFIGPDKDINLGLFGATKVEDLGDLSNTNGLFFEYFHGLSAPDKDICGRLFEQFFSGCLHESVEVEISLMSKILKGSRGLAFSRSGMVLSHIYRCLEISTQVKGAMVVPVIQGHEYVGTIVTGDFKIIQYGNTYVSGPVQGSIDGLNRVDAMAKKVATILNAVWEDLSMDGSPSVVYTFEDFNQSRKALDRFLTLDLNRFKDDTIKQVREILVDIPYGDIFPVATSELVSLFLTTIRSGNRSAISERPAFLNTEVLQHNGNQIAPVLSMFGPKPPSCQVLGRKGTRSFNFRDNSKDDPNLAIKDGKRHLQYIPIWTEGFGASLRSWVSFQSTGLLNIPEGRKGRKEFADTRFVTLQISGKDFDGTYKLYREMASAKQGTKRARDEDGEGRKGKKAKMEDFKGAF